jgi:hypothetical protein
MKERVIRKRFGESSIRVWNWDMPHVYVIKCRLPSLSKDFISNSI